MRKNYVKPILNSEEFVPQSYVAACKDSQIIGYEGVCDLTGHIFNDNGIKDVYEEKTDDYFGKNTYCNDTVITKTKPEYNAWCFQNIDTKKDTWYSASYTVGVGTGIITCELSLFIF